MAKYIEILKDGTRREVKYNPHNDGPVTRRLALAKKLSWQQYLLSKRHDDPRVIKQIKWLNFQLNLLDKPPAHRQQRRGAHGRDTLKYGKSQAHYKLDRSNLKSGPSAKALGGATEIKVTKPHRQDGARVEGPTTANVLSNSTGPHLLNPKPITLPSDAGPASQPYSPRQAAATPDTRSSGLPAMGHGCIHVGLATTASEPPPRTLDLGQYHPSACSPGVEILCVNRNGSALTEDTESSIRAI